MCSAEGIDIYFAGYLCTCFDFDSNSADSKMLVRWFFVLVSLLLIESGWLAAATESAASILKTSSNDFHSGIALNDGPF